jgi:membrane protein implicated in regulation of membrane protease activity
MPDATIASCGNCGAALRLQTSRAAVVTCAYCGVESVVGTQAASDAPTLRIAPASPPGKGIVWLVVTIVVAAMAVAGIVERATTDHGAWVPSVLFAILAVVFAWVTYHARRRRRQWDRLQTEGKPGRATVKAIRATTGRHVTLQLEIEVQGETPRVLPHATTVPELLVPRLVEGLTIPVLVDPRASERVEIQWHLV